MIRDRPLKITVVGDGTVGKTCVLIVYTKNVFPVTYVPTVFDNFSETIEVDGHAYNVSLWDTAGQEDYERLRILSYPNTDVFLLCYAVNNRTSFNNVTSKWIPELKHHCPNAPIVLVGAKVDIRKEGPTDEDCVSYAEAAKLSKKVGPFLECSAKTGENLRLVFQEAVRTAINKPKTKPRNCNLL
ncbi:ras-like GTP-binding protein RhoL [Daphnia pulex]|uniref:ras-like GTP-binding protein RhoL n=1 Tax=Daphnia pulex TaxID=6669 RepID=UPI001EDDFD09|nr:ras-like GTP-binding protein RhoL [Daphnia pulex]